MWHFLHFHHQNKYNRGVPHLQIGKFSFYNTVAIAKKMLESQSKRGPLAKPYLFFYFSNKIYCKKLNKFEKNLEKKLFTFHLNTLKMVKINSTFIFN